MLRSLLTLSALVLSLTSGFAAAGDLAVTDARIVKAVKAARSAAAYVTLDNAGEEDDRLLEVRIDGARSMLHRTGEADGVVTMSEVAEVPLPAGTTVQLEPGGLHIMVMGLAPGAAGGTLEGVLVFERAGEVAVDFPVTVLGRDRADEGRDAGN